IHIAVAVGDLLTTCQVLNADTAVSIINMKSRAVRQFNYQRTLESLPRESVLREAPVILIRSDAVSRAVIRYRKLEVLYKIFGFFPARCTYRLLNIEGHTIRFRRLDLDIPIKIHNLDF